jgi:hypothetical protein
MESGRSWCVSSSTGRKRIGGIIGLAEGGHLLAATWSMGMLYSLAPSMALRVSLRFVLNAGMLRLIGCKRAVRGYNES